MANEEKNQKRKAVGRTIIILLCCAILFFLILPFLDGSAAADSKRNAPRKNHPQIFTENPLQEMAQSILSAFGRKSRKDPFAKLWKTQTPVEKQSLIAQASPSKSPNKKPSNNIIPDPNEETIDPIMEEALFNEGGEWVLISQTEPESSNRGMHDINSSDSAYDKLIRMERQAKYTGGSRPFHPASGWARIWHPVRNIFRKFHGSDEPLALGQRPFGSARNDGDFSAGLASASASGNAPSSRSRQNSSNRTLSAQEAQNFLSSLLNPMARLENISNQLKQSARDVLKDRQAYTVEKQIDQQAQQAKNFLQTKLLADLQQAANNNDFKTAMTEAITCDNPTSASLYKDRLCDFYTPTPRSAEQDQLAQQAYQTNKQKLLNTLSTLAGENIRDIEIPTVAVYTNEDMVNSLNPADDKYKDEDTLLYQKYVAFLSDNICKSETCVWVAKDSSLQNDLTAYYLQKSAGTEPKGIQPDNEKQLQEQFKKQLEEEQKEQNPQQEQSTPITIDWKKVSPQAWAVPHSKLKEVDAQLGHPIYITTNDSVGVQVAQAAEAASVLTGNNQIYTQSTDSNIQQSGSALTNKLSQHFIYVDQLRKQAEKPLVQNGLVNILKPAIANNLKKSDLGL